MKYFPKTFNMNGYTAKHWSKMKVGDKYIAKIKLPRIQKYREASKVQWDNYYLIKTSDYQRYKN